MIEDPTVGETLTAEEPEGFTQVPDSLLLNTNISDGAYRLYAVLKHHARQRSSAYPGRRCLARELGVSSLRTVDARIKELIGAGYLKVRRRYRESGGQTSNHYHLLFYPRPDLTDPGTSDQEPGVPADTPHPTRSRRRSAPAASRPGSTRASRRPSPAARPHPEGEQSAALRSGLPGDGATGRTGPVQPAAARRSTSSPSTPTPNPDVDGAGAPHDQAGGGDGTTWAERVVAALPGGLYPTTRSQYVQMVQLLTAHDDLAGSDPTTVARSLTAGRPLPETVTHPVGLLRARLADLPPTRPAPVRAPWCGTCDERTRQLWDEQTDRVHRCPDCHPQGPLVVDGSRR